MKNYALNKEEAHDYILSYRVEKDKIILKLPRHTYTKIPYSLENETKILNIMRSQIPDKKTRIRSKEICIILLILLASFFIPACVVAAITKIGLLSLPSVLFGIVGLIIGGAISMEMMDHDGPTMTYPGLNKLWYWLENKVELNSEKLFNENVLANLSKEQVDEIYETAKRNQQPINVNNVEKFSLRDLRKIRMALETMQSFDSEEKAEEQGKSLTKEYYSNNRQDKN